MRKVTILAVLGFLLSLVLGNPTIAPIPHEDCPKSADSPVREWVFAKTLLPSVSCREKVREAAGDGQLSPSGEGEAGEEGLEPGTIEVTVYDDGNLSTAAFVSLVSKADDVDDSKPAAHTTAQQEYGRFQFKNVGLGGYRISAELRGDSLSKEVYLNENFPRASHSFYFGNSQIFAKACPPLAGQSASGRLDLSIESPEGNTLRDQAVFLREDGSFHFENLPPGRADVYWDLDGENGPYGEMSFNLAAGSSVVIGLGDCESYSRVQGIVHTPSGIPIPHLRITFHRFDSPNEERYFRGTGENGHFAFPLPLGLYYIESLTCQGREIPLAFDSTWPFLVQPGMNPLDIAIGGCSIVVSFHPIDPTIDWRYVDAAYFPEDWKERYPDAIYKADKDHRFLIPGIPPGKHLIQIGFWGCHGGVYVEQQLEVRPEDKLIELDLFE